VTSRELLIDTMYASPPQAALEGLRSADAERRMNWPSSSHSIAEIVAHMAFWQDWFLGRVNGSGELAPATASLGWPDVNQGDWPKIHKWFFEGLEEVARLDPKSRQAIDPPFEFPPMAHHAAGDVVSHVALHNAHHLGQVITLRQSMGLWPPPSGGFTW
jgi:uncharacterized damage-inducible protein DinB